MVKRSFGKDDARSGIEVSNLAIHDKGFWKHTGIFVTTSYIQ